MEEELPEKLSPRIPRPDGRQQCRQNLHVVAHSLGAQAAILASVHAPGIFSSLTVLDLAMIPAGKINAAMTKLPKNVFCLNLPETYASREDFVKYLKTSKRTKGWDERVAKIFAEHGLVPDQDSFRLVARPRLEWALYYDKQTPAHCYDRITDIAVPFHAFMPARPFAVPPKMLKADVAKMSQHTRIRWVPETTHQILFEKVDLCACFVADWLAEVTTTKSGARL